MYLKIKYGVFSPKRGIRFIFECDNNSHIIILECQISDHISNSFHCSGYYLHELILLILNYLHGCNILQTSELQIFKCTKHSIKGKWLLTLSAGWHRGASSTPRWSNTLCPEDNCLEAPIYTLPEKYLPLEYM